jgi:hypothetical protein
MLIYSDTATNPDTCGVQEVQLLKSRNRSLYLVEDPTGDYYVTVLDYDAGVDFNYTFSLQQPDGTIQKITGTFNGTTYPYEFYVEPE